MTYKIKAKGDELVEKFANELWSDKNTKETEIACAIIAVEEIIAAIPNQPNETTLQSNFPAYQYWNEVLAYLKSKQ